MKIKKLLTDESKWCKGAYAKNRWGDKVSFDSEEAVQWSLVGAVRKCYVNPDRRHVLQEIIFSLGYVYVQAWNDRPERKFEDVRSLIERLGF